MSLHREFFETPPQGPVFHYTDSRGLAGILRSKRIWATRFGFQNDPTEYRHGIEIMVRVLDGKKTKWKHPRTYHDHCLNRLQNMYQRDFVYPGYVASFCEQEDALTLWRGYGRNGGYSFGFDWKRDNNQSLILTRCAYDDEQKTQLIHSLIDEWETKEPDEIKETYPGDVPRMGDTPEEIRSWAFARNAMYFAFSFKHRAFEDEREWRVIYSPPRIYDDIPSFSERTFSLTPYVPIPLQATDGVVTVDKIIVGPHPHNQMAKAGLDLLLQHLPDVSCNEVALSKVPYRDLG